MYYCFSLSAVIMRTRLNDTFMRTYTFPVLYDFEYWKWRFETCSEFLHIAFTTVDRCRLRLKCDGTRAETRFRLSPKRTSPFKLAGASVQSTAGSRGVRISVSNVGYTMFRSSTWVLATHSIRQFPLHFPSRASPCAIRFQTHSTS